MTNGVETFTVYGDSMSGNCYKIKLLLSLLGRQYQWREIDILAGETKTEAFLSINPNGKIPLLKYDDGRVLTESNAILFHLAEGTSLLPKVAYSQAKVLQWMFFEQYSLEPNIAVARFINKYLGLPASRKAEFESKQEGGNHALKVMESHLSNERFLVNDVVSIADISLYAYTHVAEEGGFSLRQYTAIQSWIARVEDLPKYQPIDSGN